jgi:hypothetical protein
MWREQVCEFARALHTLQGIRRHRVRHRHGQGSGDAGTDLREGPGWPIGRRGTGVVGQASSEHLVEEDAGCIDVAPRSGRFSAELLGRKVRRVRDGVFSAARSTCEADDLHAV